MVNAFISSFPVQAIGKLSVAGSASLWIFDASGGYIPAFLHILMSAGAVIFLFYNILNKRETWKGNRLDNKLKSKELENQNKPPK